MQRSGVMRLEGDRYVCAFAHSQGDLYETFACPSGSSKMSRDKFAASCPSSNLPCPEGASCLCRPCQGETSIDVPWFAPIIVAPLVALIFLSCMLYSRYKLRKADSVWTIAASEIMFADPPEILGRGTFGLVVAAEYRNTPVAVKRVLPTGAMGGVRELFRGSGTLSRGAERSGIHQQMQAPSTQSLLGASWRAGEPGNGLPLSYGQDRTLFYGQDRTLGLPLSYGQDRTLFTCDSIEPNGSVADMHPPPHMTGLDTPVPGHASHDSGATRRGSGSTQGAATVSSAHHSASTASGGDKASSPRVGVGGGGQAQSPRSLMRLMPGNARNSRSFWLLK